MICLGQGGLRSLSASSYLSVWKEETKICHTYFRSYIEHIKFTDLHAADPLPLITIRDIMDTKVLLLLQALLKNFKYLL